MRRSLRSSQLVTHRQLLTEFSGALKAFLDDLKQAGLDDRVVVLAFSEFGRRVEENGSAGTDHGAAGPVFLAGSKVQRGILGEHPSLTDLDDGDLKMRFDFRQVYATLFVKPTPVVVPVHGGPQFVELTSVLPTASSRSRPVNRVRKLYCGL